MSDFTEFLGKLAPEGETFLLVRQKPQLKDNQYQFHADGAIDPKPLGQRREPAPDMATNSIPIFRLLICLSCLAQVVWRSNRPCRMACR